MLLKQLINELRAQAPTQEAPVLEGVRQEAGQQGGGLRGAEEGVRGETCQGGET